MPVRRPPADMSAADDSRPYAADILAACRDPLCCEIVVHLLRNGQQTEREIRESVPHDPTRYRVERDSGIGTRRVLVDELDEALHDLVATNVLCEMTGNATETWYSVYPNARDILRDHAVIPDISMGQSHLDHYRP